MAELTLRFPPLREYSSYQREHTIEDLGHIVDFLAAGLLVDDERLFTDFVGWLGRLLAARRVPPSSVDVALAAYHGMLYDFPRARRQLRAGRVELTKFEDTGVTRHPPGTPHDEHPR